MVNTRRSAPAVAERSLLQLERDHVASRMDFSWPPVGPERWYDESRGIENGGNICYQNSVMQTLLHQPPFLRWMFTHQDTNEDPCKIANCLKCLVRQLIEDYWGGEDPAEYVTYSNNDTQSINLAACRSDLFVLDAQEDAMLFYNWLQETLYNIPYLLTPREFARTLPDGLTQAQRRKRAAAHRTMDRPHRATQAQHDTLYRLDIQCTDTCQTCGSAQTPLEESRMLSLPVQPAFTTIYDAIASAFTETLTGVYCTKCVTNRNKNRVRHILAAPKILTIHFQILTPFAKIFHTLTYPEILDLTARQTHTTLPLRYRLTGVVAHGGSGINAGHYIASVRGRDPTEFTCISDPDREVFDLQEFLANPQRPTDEGIAQYEEGYQVYMLMYEREDDGRMMPTGQGRMRRELRNLGLS